MILLRAFFTSVVLPLSSLSLPCTAFLIPSFGTNSALPAVRWLVSYFHYIDIGLRSKMQAQFYGYYRETVILMPHQLANGGSCVLLHWAHWVNAGFAAGYFEHAHWINAWFANMCPWCACAVNVLYLANGSNPIYLQGWEFGDVALKIALGCFTKRQGSRDKRRVFFL